MGKVAGILADAVSSKATQKETLDYIDAVLAGRRKKTPEELKQMGREELEEYVADLAAKKK